MDLSIVLVTLCSAVMVEGRVFYSMMTKYAQILIVIKWFVSMDDEGE